MVVNTIKTINQDGQTSTPVANEQQILQEIANQMTARGFTQVPFTAAPTADLLINVSSLTADQKAYYPGYWCTAGFTYWAWYPTGGCTYSWSWAGTYKIGSLLIDMAPSRGQIAGDVKSIWGSLLYGIVQTGTTTAKVTSAIDQAFAQSPYIAK